MNVPSFALAPLCISLSFYSTVSFTMRPTPMPHKKAMDTYQLWHVGQRKTWDYCGGWGGEWYTSKEVVRGHTVPQFPLSYCWGWAWKLCPYHGQSSVACSSDGLGYLWVYNSRNSLFTMDQIFVTPSPSPRFICWNLMPHVMALGTEALRRCLDHENETHMNVISALIKAIP